MNNLIVRCIEIFPIQFFFTFKILTSHDSHHFFQLVFHFTLKFLKFSLNFLTNHMFKDIYSMVYEYLWPKP